jgi:hypothetical protein
MSAHIGIRALPLGAAHKAVTRNAWICDKCGFEEPLKAITGTNMLLYMAAVVVLALIVNFSSLHRWRLPIYGGLIVMVGMTTYLIARKHER